MQAPEAFRDMAVPADRLMRREDLREVLRLDAFPFRGPEIGAEKCWSVIHVMEWADGLLAENALLPFIPLLDDIPDETVVGIRLNLTQAILSAPLALRPARALIQPESGLVEKGAKRGFASGDVHRLRVLGFRTCHETLSTKLEKGPNSGNCPQDKQASCKNHYSDNDGKYGDRHKSPHRVHPGLEIREHRPESVWNPAAEKTVRFLTG